MSKFQRSRLDPSVPLTTGELNERIGRNLTNNTNDDETNPNRPSIFPSPFPISSSPPKHSPTDVSAMIERVQQEAKNGILIGGKRHSTRRRNKRTFRRKSLKTRQLFTRRKKRHDTL